MLSPLAVVLEDDVSAHADARSALGRAGVEVVVVRTPEEASAVVQSRPHAILAVAPRASVDVWAGAIARLSRARAEALRSPSHPKIDGASEQADALRSRVRELAAASGPVLLVGESGSGRTHAARSIHAQSGPDAPFVVVTAEDREAVDAALKGGHGTLFLPAIEDTSWGFQDHLASSVASGGARLMASTRVDPDDSGSRGMLSPELVKTLSRSIVRVPALRERSGDVAPLARAFIDDLRRLNGLGPITINDDASAALARYRWPGNVRQLRHAIEAAVTIARKGVVRIEDLPDDVRSAASSVQADRRFRDAKRTVVDAFERAYLEDLLKRHGGNVTGAAEQAGMLRSALQRLLRKHDLHSADFRRRAGADRFVS